MKKTKTIKRLVTTLAVFFGIGFLDGLFGLGFPQGFYTLMGGACVIIIVWLIILIYKK